MSKNSDNQPNTQSPTPTSTGRKSTLGTKYKVAKKAVVPDMCPECKTQVKGSVVTVKPGVVYHPEHFKCASVSCGKKLVGKQFYVHEDLPYCADCHMRVLPQPIKVKPRAASSPPLTSNVSSSVTTNTATEKEELDFF